MCACCAHRRTLGLVELSLCGESGTRVGTCQLQRRVVLAGRQAFSLKTLRLFWCRDQRDQIPAIRWCHRLNNVLLAFLWLGCGAALGVSACIHSCLLTWLQSRDSNPELPVNSRMRYQLRHSAMTSCTAVVLSRKDGERDATLYRNVATQVVVV